MSTRVRAVPAGWTDIGNHTESPGIHSDAQRIGAGLYWLWDAWEQAWIYLWVRETEPEVSSR